MFGGSFDPIHDGHLMMAKNALKQRKADELWFVVSAQNPFKEGSSSFHHRFKMVQLMIEPYHKMKAIDLESKLPLPSYSIDTVRILKAQNRDCEFEWLIGSDQLPTLDKWKDIDELNQRVQFIMYARDFNIETQFPIVTGPVLPISSTEIRKGSITKTSPRVLQYMTKHSLYLDEILRNRVSQKRYEHVLRVKEVALELADAHNIDKDRVTLACMIHDLCKEDSKENLLNTMKSNYPSQVGLHPAFYHGFAAASELSKKYYVRDKQVLNAIRGHVNGASTNKIGMILYIADKCERGRGYDSEPLITLSKQNLVGGFKEVKKAQDAYLRRHNE
ncbi:nicotinate (nicotinamide) nucleotide adenylyltransferase [Erysipelothrix amsterdamensis]|uniref:Probable nicotinate-nucleotide adenylyltransferase n=1 Tax=Erysipelothrix amsterdamensis TaxID=2929157 RepID=A0AAU9VHR6_9FIRM|nr:nicotinate (nicotinamide) nucleotide adenylyltransferase [Erysipelothrix sp. A18Y020d]CAH2762618.1 nicotinate (nicotinamide) nucleotide adenylyltransferase [Erysipelothrix sp. A18Y020d]